MNPQLFSALEKIKTGDLKSAMDQVYFLCSQISLAQQDILNIYTELENKVALQSRMQDGLSTVSKLGTGIISSITSGGTVLNGAGTLFSKETAIGNTIKIGAETTTITAFDVAIPDTKITVSPAITGTYLNQIYAIIKSSTKEVLTGDFDFGILNGLKFNGKIAKDSVLEHRGRMTDPTDVVNVNFVQKAVNPVMVRAQNAIQRDGDNITGPNINNKYNYVFDKVTMLFGIDSTLDFQGIISDPTSLVTKAYVDASSGGIIDDKFFAHWQTGTLGVAGSCHYSNYAGILCPFGNAPIEKSDNFDSCIQVTATGLKALGKKRRILIIASGNGGLNYGNDIVQSDMYIKKNGIVYAHSVDGYDGSNGGVGANTGTSVTALMELNLINDSVVAGYNNDQSASEMTVSIFSI